MMLMDHESAVHGEALALLPELSWPAVVEQTMVHDWMMKVGCHELPNCCTLCGALVL